MQKATDAKQTSERAEAKEQAQMDIMAYLADKTANHQDASLDDTKIQEILSDNKSYVKRANATSFITTKGEYEIPYSELYSLSNVTPSEPVEPTNSLATARAKIEDESGDCMIDENGTIMPISTWNYTPTGDDTCKIEGYYDDGNDENFNAYIGNNSLKYNIPVFIKAGTTIYTVNELGVDALAYGFHSKNVVIPSSIITIGQSAFQGSSNITSITIPDSVTSIGNYAFNQCTAITKITISDNVINMGSYAFGGWNSSQTIIVKFRQNSLPDGWNSKWNCELNTDNRIIDAQLTIYHNIIRKVKENFCK